MKSMELFRAFVIRTTGKPLEEMSPVFLSGDQVVEALWPVNDRFRPHLVQIRSLQYNTAFEKEADQAIATEALQGSEWNSVSAEAWRVLLERHIQAIMVACANQLHGSTVLPVPDGMARNDWTIAAMLFLMYEMKLPFPIADRSGFALPEGAVSASLMRH